MGRGGGKGGGGRSGGSGRMPLEKKPGTPAQRKERTRLDTEMRSVSTEISDLRSQLRKTVSKSETYRAEVKAFNKPIQARINKLTKRYKSLVDESNKLFYAMRGTG